jgi:hypothetical protein
MMADKNNTAVSTNRRNRDGGAWVWELTSSLAGAVAGEDSDSQIVIGSSGVTAHLPPASRQIQNRTH